MSEQTTKSKPYSFRLSPEEESEFESWVKKHPKIKKLDTSKQFRAYLGDVKEWAVTGKYLYAQVKEDASINDNSLEGRLYAVWFDKKKTLIECQKDWDSKGRIKKISKASCDLCFKRTACQRIQKLNKKPQTTYHYSEPQELTEKEKSIVLKRETQKQRKIMERVNTTIEKEKREKKYHNNYGNVIFPPSW